MEVLAVLPEDAAQAEAARDACGRVVQAGSVRLVVFAGDAAHAALAAAGVRVIASQADLAAMGASLTESERLFAEAWLARARAAPKSRPGDDLNWGTPPFKAP